MTAQKLNNSLATFKRYIEGLLWTGIGLFVLGSILGFFTGGFGILVIYIGATLISLSILGSFLRQTARAIIEGLDGNTTEAPEEIEPKVERLGTEFEGLASKLTYRQLVDWEKAGRPDLLTWDGQPSTFYAWLANKAK